MSFALDQLSHTDGPELDADHVSEHQVRTNVILGIRFVASCLAGRADADSEEAALAEAARAQLSAWCRRGVSTSEGPSVDARLIRRVVAQEVDLLTCGTAGAFRARHIMAGELFVDSCLETPFAELFVSARRDLCA